MIHNDVMRSIRYILNISDVRIVGIIQLGGLEIDKTHVIAYLKKEDEEGYIDCPDNVMAHFLDGLIIHKRGRDENHPPPPIELPIHNNTVLKKLRVTFELREEDILAILEQAGFTTSKPELSALFRKPDHKNYRRCGDQFLRNFLKGLTLRLRPDTR
ncbi:DUF1456 family protein [Chitinimonas sp. BJB300]|uniref:DUF1456 family protein n=1 Tax=Chitinimonas sp. BJB300 TaxID=1559339 RepID=UPI000C0D9245|nr:DUF1456 family protein [Chitinimonas sp. BJB300]PHV12168.1 hypothetical protein CSQ89_07300 [Chitinimonas sp. BJB300]TSJ90100.1 DUF1456 family protein [Chitinimonas sp. BJB300]